MAISILLFLTIGFFLQYFSIYVWPNVEFHTSSSIAVMLSGTLLLVSHRYTVIFNIYGRPWLNVLVLSISFFVFLLSFYILNPNDISEFFLPSLVSMVFMLTLSMYLAHYLRTLDP